MPHRDLYINVPIPEKNFCKSSNTVHPSAIKALTSKQNCLLLLLLCCSRITFIYAREKGYPTERKVFSLNWIHLNVYLGRLSLVNSMLYHTIKPDISNKHFVRFVVLRIQSISLTIISHTLNTHITQCTLWRYLLDNLKTSWKIIVFQEVSKKQFNLIPSYLIPAREMIPTTHQLCQVYL